MTARKRKRTCELYSGGHTVHYIQAIHSAGEPHREGTLIAVEDNVITVEFDDGQIEQFRNHEAERLLGIIGMGGYARVCDSYNILRSIDRFCFSISPIERDWTPCDYKPLTSASPEALAERVQTHGGFLVSGRAALAALEESAVPDGEVV